MNIKEITRRGFLQRAGIAVGGAVSPLDLTVAADRCAGGRNVALVHDPADGVAASAPAQWALGELRQALIARGFGVRRLQRLDDVRPGERCVLAAGAVAPRARALLDRSGGVAPSSPEALALLAAEAENRPVVLACGGDARGLTYALLELADRVAYADQQLAALHPRARAVAHRNGQPHVASAEHEKADKSGTV